MDETEGVSNVNMTENRNICDHPWPYMRMFEIVWNVLRHKGFLVNALRVYCVFLYFSNIIWGPVTKRDTKTGSSNGGLVMWWRVSDVMEG